MSAVRISMRFETALQFPERLPSPRVEHAPQVQKSFIHLDSDLPPQCVVNLMN